MLGSLVSLVTMVRSVVMNFMLEYLSLSLQ